MKEFTLETKEGMHIACREFAAENPSSVLMVIHGMAEHAGRYLDFGKWMQAQGVSVFLFDLRGHGKTAGSLGRLGHFANRLGWPLVISDVEKVMQTVEGRYPGIPHFILGHSMGSLIARTLLKSPLQGINGIILSGTMHNPGFITKLGIALAKAGGTLLGYRKHSHLHDKLTFGSFNKPFKEGHSRFRWLSRDTDKVKAYEADLFCGTVGTFGFFRDMLSGLKALYEMPDHTSNKNMPIFIIAGDNDPVGNFGKDIEKVYQWYQERGFQAITYKLYEGARHEVLNETNRKEVYQDVYNWMLAYTPSDRAGHSSSESE